MSCDRERGPLGHRAREGAGEKGRAHSRPPRGPPAAPQGESAITEPIGVCETGPEPPAGSSCWHCVLCPSHPRRQQDCGAQAGRKADAGLAAGGAGHGVAPGVGRHFFGDKEGKLPMS